MGPSLSVTISPFSLDYIEAVPFAPRAVCACAGSCGGRNDHRVKKAEHNLGRAEASGNQSAIEKAATAVAAAAVECQKTSGRKRDGGRLATHMWVCMYVGM